jgi:hypothetical protein
MTIFLRYQENVKDLQKFNSWMMDQNIDRWIYLGTKSMWRIGAERSFSVPRVSISDEMREVSTECRQQYIDIIGKTSLLNNSFEWWSSDIASKDPYTYLFAKSCLAEVTNRIDLSGDVCIITSTPGMFKTVKVNIYSNDCDVSIIESFVPPAQTVADALPAMSFFGYLSSEYKRYIGSRPDYRLKKFTDSDIPKFDGSMFTTWATGENIKDGKYVDGYFGVLPNHLKKRGHDVAFNARILPEDDFESTADKLLNCNEKMYFPEMFITKEDVKECTRIANEFDPKIPPSGSMIGTTFIYPLIKEQIDLMRRWHVGSLLYRSAVRGMYDHGVIPSTIYYSCEGQSWENSLVYALREKMPKTRIVAYDNSTFTKMACSLYPSEKELTIRPFPDTLITQGYMFADTLTAYGYPKDRIAVGCGLRQSITSPAERAYDRTGNIVIATSINVDETTELLYKVLSALGGDSRYNLIIKAHPLLDIPLLTASVGDPMLHKNVSITSRKTDILAECDAMFYYYTSVCFDALRYGAIPVFVRGENSIDMDRLDASPEIRRSVCTREDILKETEGISSMTSDERREWHKKALRVLENTMSPANEVCLDRIISVGGSNGV